MKIRALWLLALWASCTAVRAEDIDADDAVSAALQAPLSTATLLQSGRATWYGGKRWHGRRTASGERFDRHALTAAHPSLPLGSWVRVRHTGSGREVLLRINDRGPGGRRFIIDLSEAAAQRLGFREAGHASVEIHRATAPQTHHDTP